MYQFLADGLSETDIVQQKKELRNWRCCFLMSDS